MFGFANNLPAEKYALIVGVNKCPKYVLVNNAKHRALRGAGNDVEKLSQLLVDSFNYQHENIVVLRNEKASLNSIQLAFSKMAEKITENDRFLFHFSGHGTQILDQIPFDEPDKLDEALCPFDAQSDGKNLLRDDQLGLWLEEIVAQDIVVILDCCHSGTGVKDGNLDDAISRYLPCVDLPATGSKQLDYVDPPWLELEQHTKTTGRSIRALFACKADQSAYERRFFFDRSPYYMGQFTHYVLEGLSDGRADANTDGEVSLKEIINYSRKKMDHNFNRSREPESRQYPSTQYQGRLDDASTLISRASE